MRKQILNEEKGKIKLIQVVNIEPNLARNQLEKQIIGKGFSKKRTLRKVASIPIDVFFSMDPQKALEILYDDRKMRQFLREHPEFRCSEGGI